MKVIPDPTGPGRESVWSSFPRPAVAEPSQRHLKIVHRDVIIADTRNGIRTLETSHPPSYYFPPDDIAPFVLHPSRRRTFCEWKGEAIYFDVLVAKRCAMSPGAIPIRTRLSNPCAIHVAFYAWPFDGCSLNDERATPQPGKFYGGWISSDVAGPFKGVSGTRFW